jgi:predicted alpha/beta-fold hydrolase
MITESRFKPLWYLRNPHLQTLLANLLHPPFPEVSYETLDLPDGDSLDLAWGTARGKSVVLILHGLEGSLRSAYAQRMMNALNTRGIPGVFMFFRSCNGRPNRLARSYHSGETGDLGSVLRHLESRGIERIALVGYSLGGNVALKYLGESQPLEAVRCAVAVSVPMLLANCAERMDRGFSRIYQWELLKRLKRKVGQKKLLLEEQGHSAQTSHIRNFEQFDDQFTARLHGYASALDYYAQCSSRQFLGSIDRPTLIVHSRDDPFMTDDVVPLGHELSEHVQLELSDHGGHVGFIGGGGMLPSMWLEDRVLDFVTQHL